MIIFIFGQQSYLVFDRYLQLKEDFRSKNQSAPVVEFDLGEHFDPVALKEALAGGGGLFAAKKFVSMKDAFLLSAANQKNLAMILDSADAAQDESVVLVMAEIHSKKPTGPLLKWLKKNAEAEEKKPLTPKELGDWANSELARANKNLAMDRLAFDELVQLTGGDLWLIKQEIWKLASFKDSGTINKQDVGLMSRGKTFTKIFDLVDAIGQNNKARALKYKSDLIDQGANEHYLFVMIISQLRNILSVSKLLGKGLFDERRISKELLLHPFVAKKSAQQSRNFTSERLKCIFQLSAELDRSSKDGRQTMEEALDYLIMKM